MARTRSASAHEKVLQATLELVAQRGIAATSMDAVAQQSGVSKATIYKHWEDKQALLLEMLAWVSGLKDRPAFDSGDTQSDIAAVLAYRPKEHADWRERINPQFVAYGVTNPSFGFAWRNMVMEPPRRELRHLLLRGIQKGELVATLDIEAALALLLGPILYWHIFRKQQPQPGSLSPLAEWVAGAFWKAFGLRPGRKARP
jgi:AcrR family transcriptional regulator